MRESALAWLVLWSPGGVWGVYKGTGVKLNQTLSFSVRETPVNIFYVFSFSKVFVWRKTSEASFFSFVFFGSPGLDSIMLRKLIKILKYKEVTVSILYILCNWDCKFFGETNESDESFPISLHTLVLFKCYNVVQNKTKIINLKSFFFFLKVENDTQNYKSNLMYSIFVSWHKNK